MKINILTRKHKISTFCQQKKNTIDTTFYFNQKKKKHGFY